MKELLKKINENIALYNAMSIILQNIDSVETLQDIEKLIQSVNSPIITHIWKGFKVQLQQTANMTLLIENLLQEQTGSQIEKDFYQVLYYKAILARLKGNVLINN